MDSNNPQLDENYIDDPSLMPVADEKYSNIQILDLKPIHYKDSPFDKRKAPRKNIDNKDSSAFKNRSENEEHSEFSEEKPEDTYKKKKRNEMIKFISEPLYNEDNLFTVTKIQTNINPQPNGNIHNSPPIKKQKEIGPINKKKISEQNSPEEQIIYIDTNYFNYTQVPSQITNENESNQINNKTFNQTYNQYHTISENLPRHKYSRRKSIYRSDSGFRRGRYRLFHHVRPLHSTNNQKKQRYLLW